MRPLHGSDLPGQLLPQQPRRVLRLRGAWGVLGEAMRAIPARRATSAARTTSFCANSQQHLCCKRGQRGCELECCDSNEECRKIRVGTGSKDICTQRCPSRGGRGAAGTPAARRSGNALTRVKACASAAGRKRRSAGRSAATRRRRGAAEKQAAARKGARAATPVRSRSAVRLARSARSRSSAVISASSRARR